MQVKKIDTRFGSTHPAVANVGCLVEDHVIGAINHGDGALEAMESKLTALTCLLANLVDILVQRDVLPPEDLQHIIDDYGVEYEHVEE